MANEKMMILRMLEEGKINAEEAARLMEASDGRASSIEINKKRAAMSDAGSFESQGRFQSESRHQSGFGRSGQSQQNRNTGSIGLDDFTSDLSRKFDTLARDMEPKIQKIAESVIETTAGMADKLSKSISGFNSPSETYARRPAPGQMESDFELLVTPGYCELNFSALNGNIRVNGYNGDKITAKVYYRKRLPHAYLDLMKLGDKYFLNYDSDAFEFVEIDAYVPETMFQNIKLETVNGRILAETLSAKYMDAISSNGSVELKKIIMENLKASTSNGPMNIVGVKANNASIDLSNGAFNAHAIDIANFMLSTSNGPVTINVDYFNSYSDYTWVLEAANGKFVMNMPSLSGLGYHIKAQTSLSNVKLGLMNMEYIVNQPNYAEAKSYDFDSSTKKVKIKAETSNASLVIN